MGQGSSFISTVQGFFNAKYFVILSQHTVSFIVLCPFILHLHWIFTRILSLNQRSKNKVETFRFKTTDVTFLALMVYQKAKTFYTIYLLVATFWCLPTENVRDWNVYYSKKRKKNNQQRILYMSHYATLGIYKMKKKKTNKMFLLSL